MKSKQISKEKSISGSHDTNLLSCLESIPGSDDGSWGGMSVGNFSLIWFDKESFVFVHLILPGELIKESMPCMDFNATGSRQRYLLMWLERGNNCYSWCLFPLSLFVF